MIASQTATALAPSSALIFGWDPVSMHRQNSAISIVVVHPHRDAMLDLLHALAHKGIQLSEGGGVQ